MNEWLEEWMDRHGYVDKRIFMESLKLLLTRGQNIYQSQVDKTCPKFSFQ